MSFSDCIPMLLRPLGSGALAAVALAGLTAVPAPVTARVLDFAAALQELDTGTVVEDLEADGATMHVVVHNAGFGPNVLIVFDSEEPSGDDQDLGTPNESFGGPGIGDGGAKGEEGENGDELGNVLIIAENVDDDDGDGLVDVPDDESDGGTVWLKFSHAGRLSLTIVDVDEEEDAPQFCLYHDGEFVAEVEGESLGDNSLQDFDFSEFGDIDAVKIELDGSASIGNIQLDVAQVGVEARSWSTVKQMFR